MAATTTNNNTAFQIMQDAGKENPRNVPIMKGKSNVLQPLGASTLTIAGGGVSLKQGRANFAVLNSNANVRTAVTHNNNNNGGNKVVSSLLIIKISEPGERSVGKWW